MCEVCHPPLTEEEHIFLLLNVLVDEVGALRLLLSGCWDDLDGTS